MLSYKNLPDFGRELLFALFAAQRNLEIVTLNELDGDEVFMKDLIFCIFENCPKMRELQLRFKNEDETGASLPLRSVTFATYSEFARFFSYMAKLECFVVNFDIELDFPDDLLAALPSTSFTMKQLHLDQSIRSEQFCRSVLQRCSELTYLKVAFFTDDILQEIFKNVSSRVLFVIKCSLGLCSSEELKLVFRPTYRGYYWSPFCTMSPNMERSLITDLLAEVEAEGSKKVYR